MKDIGQSIPADRHVEDFGNRKLIRPSLNHSGPGHQGPNYAERRERTERLPERSNGGRKAPPPEQTNAENFYYQKQMQTKTPMVFVLRDGEVLRGIIEWYDKSCLKVNRVGEPNLLLYKPNIKYMYKDE